MMCNQRGDGETMADDITLSNAVVSWAKGRPNWEQTALGLLARGHHLDSIALEQLADEAEAQAAGAAFAGDPLTSNDLGPSGDVLDTVRLLAIHEPTAINALVSGDGVTFETDGITLIYGHNGSGKSGYARVLKTVTRARDQTEVLGDVFAPHAEQSAKISVLNGANATSISWPADSPDTLRQVSFYDSGCADRYVSAETEVAYRPWEILLLDKLVTISGQVRTILESRQQATALGAFTVEGVDPATQAGQFLGKLSAETTPLDLDLRAEVPADVEDRLESLTVRIRSLRASDPEARTTELRRTLTAITTIENAITTDLLLISKEQTDRLKIAVDKAADTRTAARRASALWFDAEPVAGVGDPTWIALWESARKFSETAAYPQHSFPHTDNGASAVHCVLCQQRLDDDAAERLRRFEEFVVDDTENAARNAEVERDRLAQQLRTFATSETTFVLAVQRIEGEQEALAEVRNAVALLDLRRHAVLEALNDGPWPDEANDVTADLHGLKTLRVEVADQLDDLLGEDLAQQATTLEAEAQELRSRLALRRGQSAVLDRIDVLRVRQRLDAAIRFTNTNGITRRAAELTRSHVSDVMKHRFSQETLQLGLKRVRLGDAGGGQGNLRHRAQFVGALHPAPVHAVLSEGEQTALGLAGFLTEVESDTSQSAVVFDDPVTSLDHVRQEKVAQRLVQLAASRQVIVFTHDIGFVVDIKRAAEESGRPVAERQISRHADQPGSVSQNGPWESQNVGQRVSALEERIAQIRAVHDTQRRSDDIRHWYQDLRLAWERSLEEAVLDKVTARSRLELRPSGLKGLVRIDDEDNRIFQAAFTRCGDRGSHDRNTQLNRPTPPIEELTEDLATLQTWNKRVKAYR